jgi:outer membrane protein TolC
MMISKSIFSFAIAAVLFSAVTAQAGSPGRTTLVLDLDECIRTAIAVAPELGEAQADIDQTASRLDEAKSNRYPQVDVMTLFGPAPSARRSDISPTIVTDKAFRLKDTTWFSSADLTLVQPLWTFGKISENMKAANHGIEVGKAKKQQKGNEVALAVKEYYYGLLLARELKGLLGELQEYMTKGRDTVKRMLAQEIPSADEMDILKIDSYAGEINKFQEEALKGEQLALAALKARLFLGENVDLEISTENLLMDTDSQTDLVTYMDRARLLRPEYKQLKEGIAAREALVDAAKAAYYPDIFVAGIVSWAYADDRDRIKNPYITDRFNHFYGGAALGLRWHFDFGIIGSKVSGEQAQLNRLQSTKAYAETFIPLQIRKAWLEMKEAEKVVVHTQNAFASAKKWGALALANFDFGIGPSRDIFDALQVYAKMKADYYKAIYNYKMAKANLDYAIGELPPGPRK